MDRSCYSQERLVAELAVQRASVLAKGVMREVLAGREGEMTKTDKSPVTIADFAGQALMISALHSAFPTDRFVGEEGAEALRQDCHLRDRVWELVSSARLQDAQSDALLASPASAEEMMDSIDLGRDPGGPTGRVWVMDPIDGTAAFLKGQQFAVSLALLVDGREEIGVVGCPNLRPDTVMIQETVVDDEGYGLMVSAERGQGALLRPIGDGSLRKPRTLEKFQPPTGEGASEGPHFVESSMNTSCRLDLVGHLATTLGSKFPGTDVWSSHIKYVALILGGGDLLVRIPRRGEPVDNHIWDHAGAQLIFSERGGNITDLRGRKIDFGAGRRLSNNCGLVLSKDWLSARILDLVRDLQLDDEGM